MKKWITVIVSTVCLFIGLIFMLTWVIYQVPYIYTVVAGDANTRILYDAYRFAQKNPDRKVLENYLMNKEIEYSYNEEKNQYILMFGDTSADAVYITYDNDNRLSEVHFSPD